MTIAANTTITQSGYHYILDTLKTVLSTASTGYGVLPNSDYIGTGTLITTASWVSIYEDLTKIWTHQNGVSLPLPPNGYPVKGVTRLSRAYANTLTEAVDSIVANKYTAHPSQLTRAVTGSTSLGTGTFTSVLTNTVMFVWPDELAADWHFNLGGYIAQDLSAPVPVTTDTQYLQAVNLVNDFRSTITAPFNRAAWLATKAAPGKTVTTSLSTVTTNGTFTGYFTVSNTYQIIDSATSSTLRVTTEIIPPGVEEVLPQFHLTATTTVTNYWSTGAIESIDPETTLVEDFNSNTATVNVRRTRTLSVSPTALYYTVVGGSTSSIQTVTITNNNVDVTSSVATITEITTSSNNVIPRIMHDALPITLAVGSSTSVDLYWAKPTVTAKDLGDYANYLTIKSNNTRGDLIVPTRVTVQEPPGTWSLSPSSSSQSLTSYKKLVESVRIVPQYSQLKNITVASLTSPSGNFSLTKLPSVADPVAVVTYEPKDTTTAVYVATLTVTAEVIDITGDYIPATHSFTFTVDQNLQDSNLGIWVSPTGPINSVIGASYDIIGGQRYLTVGVGTGADGSPTIDAGGAPYARPEYLSINNHSLTPSIYLFKKYTSSYAEWASFGQFMKDYGIISTQPYITTRDPESTFEISLGSESNYEFKYAVYGSGYVQLNDDRVVNLSVESPDNYIYGTSSTVHLTAGVYKLKFMGNLRLALTVTDTTTKQIVWSTLNITQEGPAFRNWYEVYRFPIYTDGKYVLLRSKDYRVKNTAQDRTTAAKKYYPYGEFFGRSKEDFGSIFEVRSLGNGQVTISIVPPIQQGNIEDTLTVGSLSFAFYYVQRVLPRYTNKLGGKYDGDTKYTDYFVGFDPYGGIRTDKRLIPDKFNYDGKNNILDLLVTFFLSNLFIDLITIELGLFTSYWGYNVSFGAWLLEKVGGVDLLGSQTAGGWIVDNFSTFFSTELQLPTEALEYLAGIQDSVLATGKFVSEATRQILSGVDAVYAPLSALGQDAVLLNKYYVGESAAEVYGAQFTSELTPVLVEAIGAEGAVFAVGAAGIALTAVGISSIKRGIENGDVGAIAIGAAATYGGWALAGDLILGAASTGGCFAANTPVEMADGSVKLIKDVKIGDLVFNRDKTKTNKILMIQEADSRGFADTLWSPNKDIEPFATLNHPIYIDGKLSAADPDIAMTYQPWIGQVEKVEGAVISKIKNQKVYNIYPDGDATFRVYEWGAPSLADGDTTTFRMYEQGVITFEQAQDVLNGIIDESEKYGPNVIYGGVVLDRIMRRINSDLLMKYAIKMWLLKNPALRGIMFRFVTLVGDIAAKLKKKDK